MEIGDLVSYRDRACYLRGLEPMSGPGRRAEVEVVATGELLLVPLHHVEPAPGYPLQSV